MSILVEFEFTGHYAVSYVDMSTWIKYKGKKLEIMEMIEQIQQGKKNQLPVVA